MGWHLNFDGVDDLVTAPDDASLDFGAANFTVAVVIQTSVTTGGIVSKGDATTWWQFKVFTGKLSFSLSDNVTQTGNDLGSSDVNDGVPHHIAVVINRVLGQATLYIDGIQDAAIDISSVVGTIDNNVVLRLGTSRAGAESFNGRIDNIRLWGRALSVSDLADDARNVVASDDLDLRWDMNEGSGTTTVDSSNNTNDGTISGAAWSSGSLEPRRVIMTVWEHAGEVALDDPIQYTAAVIGGVASSAITGNGKKRRRVRLFSNVDAWVKWGENPTATGGSDSMALSANNPEYVDIESGHILHAISR